ncbi:hypothetical protein CC86DRAFT_463086 [Ophiobolus disseminans]|uniref:Uncharacterized protein n=1 Tax=Ophiobolus disseminans TaxID=1469910 RepID=A0A6A7AEM0_9PLEO|nr:hypothetical protein CC86DRAFT_463086 [Ophiobolus disseminans]
MSFDPNGVNFAAVERLKRSRQPVYEYEMPPVAKPSITYRLSRVTSLGKRKRTAPETSSPHNSSLPNGDSIMPVVSTTEGDHVSHEHSGRRRHSSIADQFDRISLQLKDSWKWLRKDSTQTPDSIELLLERATAERNNAPPGLSDARERVEGRANIPRVIPYLDSMAADGPSNFYNTRHFQRAQRRAAAADRRLGHMSNSLGASSPSSAEMKPPNIPTTPDPGSGFFRNVPRFSRPNANVALGRRRSWSPSKTINKLLKRPSKKSRGKQPDLRPEGELSVNVPQISGRTVLPVTIVSDRRLTSSSLLSVSSNDIDSSRSWTSSNGSSNDLALSYDGSSIDKQQLPPRLDLRLVSRLNFDEHSFPSQEADADNSQLDGALPSQPLPCAPLQYPRPETPSVDNSSLTDLRPRTGGGLTPNGRHLISRSTSDNQMTFPMSPSTSLHKTSSAQQLPTEPDNYPDLPFDMTRRRSTRVQTEAPSNGTETSVDNVVIDHAESEDDSAHMESQSASPPSGAGSSWVIASVSSFDGPNRSAKA